MVAAQGQHGYAGLDDGSGVPFDTVGDGFRFAVVENAIPVVDHRQRLEGIETPGPGAAGPGQVGGGRAHAGRAEACARPVGGGEIQRHAADRHIDAGEIAAVAPAHEAAGAGVG